MRMIRFASNRPKGLECQLPLLFGGLLKKKRNQMINPHKKTNDTNDLPVELQLQAESFSLKRSLIVLRNYVG